MSHKEFEHANVSEGQRIKSKGRTQRRVVSSFPPTALVDIHQCPLSALDGRLLEELVLSKHRWVISFSRPR